MADRRLQVFHAVARHLSFTKAAEALLMTQPAVTFQIKQLEDQYNVRLFERGHGRISLTPAGEMVLEYADQILGLTDELEARLGDMTGLMRGTLVIGASTTIAEFMLPTVLGEFNALYPQVKPRLIVGNSELIQNRVAEHGVDIGLVESVTTANGLLAESCSPDELVVICAPDYPLAGRQQIPPEELLDYEYIAREPGSGTRETVEQYFRTAGFSPDQLKTLMELGSPEALKGVVMSGLGFSIVSRAVAKREVQQKRLITVTLSPRLHRTLMFVYPKDKFRSKMLTTFVDFAKRRLKEERA